MDYRLQMKQIEQIETDIQAHEACAEFKWIMYFTIQVW